MISTLFSVTVSVLILLFTGLLLQALFGKVDRDVMRACVTYLRISVYSFPALGIYNARAALFRSVGKANVTMYISAVANLINIAGNLVGVFILKAGGAGVAYSFAGPLGSGLRAAGDVRFTMLVSIGLIIGAKLCFSAFSAWYFNGASLGSP